MKTTTQTADLSQHAMWPGGEAQSIRVEYDKQLRDQASQTIPAPRGAS